MLCRLMRATRAAHLEKQKRVSERLAAEERLVGESLPWELTVASNPGRSVTALSRELGVSRRQVRRAAFAAAHIWLEQQEKMLLGVQQRMEALAFRIHRTLSSKSFPLSSCVLTHPVALPPRLEL